MKIIKILMKVTGVILFLILAVIGVFLATFDANQYKQDLSDLVQQETGRALTFQGDIGLTLYPTLGMKLGSMQFENAKGFGEQPMLAVKYASVSVDVLSLLTFTPRIAQLQLDGLELDLRKNKQGKTNWDDLVKSSDDPVAPTEPEAKTPSSTPDSAEGSQGLSLVGSFGGLKITQARMNWNDETSDAAYLVLIKSLTTGAIEAGQAFPLLLDMQVDGGQDLNALVELNAQVLLDEKSVRMNELKLLSTVKGKMLPVEMAKLDLMADIDFSLTSNQLSVKGFNTKLDTQGGMLKKVSAVLSGEVGFDLNSQQLTIAVLDLQADLQDPTVPKEQIKVAISSAQMAMKVEQRSIKLDDLTLALNEYQFKGQVDVSDYAQPAASFDLTSQLVDVDKILGESKTEEPAATEAAEKEPAADVPIELPMELLRSIKLDGKLAIGKLIAKGVTVQNVVVVVTADKGLVDIKPLKMELYDGTFNGAVQVNAKGDKPAYSVVKKLSAFQIGGFLKDLVDNDMLSGQTNVDVNLTTKGDWLSQLKSNLNGSMSVSVNDGALKGFNIRHKVESAKAKLKKETAPDLVEKKTDFSALSLSGKIVQGVFSSQDLDMQAPLMRLNGKGSADLAKETVDYLVNAKLVATSKGQQSGGVDDLSGLLIPVAIKGSWLSPEIDVQYDELLKASLNAKKAKISESVAKQKEAVQQQLAQEKARLKAAQEKQAAAQKAKLEEKRKLVEAEKKAELDARKKEEQDKASQKLQDKLKKLF